MPAGDRASYDAHVMLTSRLIIRVTLGGAFALLPFSAALPQAAVVLAPATRIRFTTVPNETPVIAEVIAHRGDSLWVRRVDPPANVALAIPELATLDVSRGQKHHVLLGAGIGLAVGAIAGAIDGAAAGCGSNAAAGCQTDRASAIGTNAVFVGVLGATIGAVVGWFVHTERWEGVTLAHPRPGAQFGARGFPGS